MKITTPAGIIECTVDEYEELVVRGLVPGKEQLNEQNSDDDLLQKLQRIDKQEDTPYWMKLPQPITVHGCQSVDQTQFTANATNNDITDNKTQLT